MQKMLIENLGFGLKDIEMSYFDVEPVQGAKSCTKGQDPPTATRFKTKFENLISDALAGAVRFVYVDAQRPNAALGGGGGWILAKTDDGTENEIVDDNWVAQTIRTVSAPTRYIPRRI